MNKKIGIWAGILVATAALLAGCSGFWDLPPSSNNTPTSTTLSSGYFYVLDVSTSQVISYYINSGTLTPVGSPVTVPSEPIAITVAPNDQFLYVSALSSGTGAIYVYTISNGSLTLGNNQQPIASDPALEMQVDSTDSWLVETSGQGTLNAIPIVSTNGDLNTSAPSCSTQNNASSPICTVPLTGSTIHQLAIAPNNQYVFVASGTNGTEAFTFSAGTNNSANPFGSAAYQTVGPVTNGTGAALSAAVDPSNRVLYVGEEAGSGAVLRVFTIGTSGALSELTGSGSPFTVGGSGPYGVLPTSTGDYVYVASWNGTSAGIITGFSISDSNSTFSLTKLSGTNTTGDQPTSLVEDSDHNFVLAESSGGNPNFDAYYFDTTTAGQLDLTIKSSTYAGASLAANH